ncbi:MAG: hypothetical protein WAV76_05830 [Bacteroidota bacterium]
MLLLKQLFQEAADFRKKLMGHISDEALYDLNNLIMKIHLA